MKKYLIKVEGDTKRSIQVTAKNTRLAVARVLKALDDNEANMVEEIKIYEINSLKY